MPPPQRLRCNPRPNLPGSPNNRNLLTLSCIHNVLAFPIFINFGNAGSYLSIRVVSPSCKLSKHATLASNIAQNGTRHGSAIRCRQARSYPPPSSPGGTADHSPPRKRWERASDDRSPGGATPGAHRCITSSRLTVASKHAHPQGLPFLRPVCTPPPNMLLFLAACNRSRVTRKRALRKSQHEVAN